MKRILVLISCFLIFFALMVVPIGAASNSYQYGADYSIYHPVSQINSIEMDFVPDGESGARQFLTFDIDSSYMKFQNSQAFLLGADYKLTVQPSDLLGVGSDQFPLVQPYPVTQDVNIGFWQNLDGIIGRHDSLVVYLPFNDQIEFLQSETTANVHFEILPEGDYRYMHVDSFLNYFIPLIEFNHNSLVTSENWYCSVHLTWIEENPAISSGNVTRYSMVDRVYAANSIQDLKVQIVNDWNNGSGAATLKSDIIGVDAFEINCSFYAEGEIINNGLDGSFRIYLPLSNGSFQPFNTINDFTDQGFFGEKFTEVVYINELDIGSVFDSVRGALATDLIGPISFLDILTIIVCLSVTVWILKVFAGG